MNNAIIASVLLAVAVVGMTSATCPMYGCTMEYYFDMVHLPTEMDYNGERCTLCNTWINPDTIPSGGCPEPACTYQAIPEGCSRDTFINIDGLECPWCPYEAC